MRPRRLETSTDYRPALLWLMGELGRARTSDAIAEFERRLGHLIPPEHREENDSGNIKWEWYVRWSRQDLVNDGRMGSGGRGIWTITEAGRKWLKNQGEGGKRAPEALVRDSTALGDGPARLDRNDAQLSGYPGLSRDAFYRTILERLKGKLPGGIHNRSYNPEVNYLRLNHPAPRTYYEITLHKSVTYVGLVFYGPGDENRARLAPFQEVLPQLEAELERSVETHIGGESYSTVRLRLPPARLEVSTARQLADTWLSFIEATLPVLEQVVAEFGLLVSTSTPVGTELERPQAILAREIRKIRAYLDGDPSLSPSDQKLCSWIQFCYTFELFSEGAVLFKLVRGDAVDPWQYERTQKLARVCELRADR
ncbi:MAG: winged helix-turn-helix domain-containing protein [bacterium]